MKTKTQDSEKKAELKNALIRTQHSVGRLHEILNLDTGIDLEAFSKVLGSKLITQLDPSYPLMVAITGGGSTGKSSLFNALVGKNLSAVKARAGLSRRVLAAIHPDVLARDDFLASLFEAFGANPEPLGEIAELTTSGTPKYVSCDKISPSLILLDTPDFDTGDCVDYANRSVTKPVLEACDVFLYIFTGVNFNNRANTEFIRTTLKSVGSRKVILVYRCSRVLVEEEVREHASIVSENLYGPDFKPWLKGIFRINEDDDVAGGHTFLQVDPLNGEKPIREVLASLDCAQTRSDFRRTALLEVAGYARKTVTEATIARMELELYGYAVGLATSWAVLEALESFPQRDLTLRFREIWEQGQPRGLKFVKFVGRVCTMGVPWVAKKVLEPFRKEELPPKDTPFEEIFKKKLFEAATGLRNDLLGQELVVKTIDGDPDGKKIIRLAKEIQSYRPSGKFPVVETSGNHEITIRVARPVSIIDVKEVGREKPWNEQLEEIKEEAFGSLGVSKDFDCQLRKIADDFRSNMEFKAKLREGFTAWLPALTATGAVIYVLSTGDAVGGAGIYANLGALFGLNDLAALLVIPASMGLEKADRENLQRMLNPILEAWFNDKKEIVRGFFERHIYGTQIEQIKKMLGKSEKPLTELNQAVAAMAEEKMHE